MLVSMCATSATTTGSKPAARQARIRFCVDAGRARPAHEDETLLREFAQIQPALTAPAQQPMPDRQHQQQFLLQQFEKTNSGRPRHGHAQQGHLDVAPHQRLGQVGCGILVQVESNLRIVLRGTPG